MKKILLFDNYGESYSYDDYKEWCAENGLEPKKDGSNDYWDFVSSMQEMEWDDLLTNIEYGKYANKDMLVYGTLGLWIGEREICPVVKCGLANAIKESIGRDTNYLQVHFVNGTIELTCIHHDGTNHIIIKPISEKRAKNKGREEIEDSKNPVWYSTKFKEFIY